MLISIHLVTGAAIGKMTGNLWLTIPMAFVSHYFLDAIPHYNQKPVKDYLEKGLAQADKKDLFLKSIEPVMGLVLVFCSIFYFSNKNALPMIVGAFFGLLPDLLLFIKWKYNIETRPVILRKAERDWNIHTAFIPGMIPQFIILLLAASYICL